MVPFRGVSFPSISPQSQQAGLLPRLGERLNKTMWMDAPEERPPTGGPSRPQRPLLEGMHKPDRLAQGTPSLGC